MNAVATPGDRRAGSARYRIPSVLDYPDPEHFPPELWQSMVDTSDHLNSVGETHLKYWHRVLSFQDEEIFTGAMQQYGDLFNDPLKDVYREYHGWVGAVPTRTHVEMQAIEKFATHVLDAVTKQDFPMFLQALIDVAGSNLGTPARLRREPVFIAPDARGGFVEYPEHTLVEPQLSAVFNALGRPDLPVMYRACICYVMTIGAHPFVDGNGRLARMLFNVALMFGGLHATSYIPLKELYDFSRGVISIQTRRALLRSDWTGIARTLNGAVRFAGAVNDAKQAQPRACVTPINDEEAAS